MTKLALAHLSETHVSFKKVRSYNPRNCHLIFSTTYHFMFLTQQIWLFISAALCGRHAVKNINRSLEKNYLVPCRFPYLFPSDSFQEGANASYHSTLCQNLSDRFVRMVPKFSRFLLHLVSRDILTFPVGIPKGSSRLKNRKHLRCLG
jgi:hypothetical protein